LGVQIYKTRVDYFNEKDSDAASNARNISMPLYGVYNAETNYTTPHFEVKTFG
jgi:hypothetical protein